MRREPAQRQRGSGSGSVGDGDCISVANLARTGALKATDTADTAAARRSVSIHTLGLCCSVGAKTDVGAARKVDPFETRDGGPAFGRIRRVTDAGLFV